MRADHRERTRSRDGLGRSRSTSACEVRSPDARHVRGGTARSGRGRRRRDAGCQRHAQRGKRYKESGRSADPAHGASMLARVSSSDGPHRLDGHPRV